MTTDRPFIDALTDMINAAREHPWNCAEWTRLQGHPDPGFVPGGMLKCGRS